MKRPINPHHWKNISLKNIRGEKWKKLQGFDCVYEVSNKGRVKSPEKLVLAKGNSDRLYVCRKKARLFRQHHCGQTGYLQVILYKYRRKVCFSVQRLVALLFITNPKQKRFVNHKFGDKLDNRDHKLEWATPSENLIHSYRILKNPHARGMLGKPSWNKGKKKWMSKEGLKRLRRSVIQFDLSGKRLKKFPSITVAANKTNSHISGISTCSSKKGKTHNGFIWEYA